MTPLVVATQNPGKLAEMQHHLSEFSWELQFMPAGLEIEETGQTFAENAALKACQVAEHTGQWAIADDSGLEVMALKGAPGIYSARYGKTDADRIQRLLTALGDVGNDLRSVGDHRSAQFVCAIALARPDGRLACQAQGVCLGEILMTPQGEGGFGYDPIFYVPSMQRTFAELSRETKQRISHRGEAFKALRPQLLNLQTELGF
ncbi:MAG: RdgB/HAM1 family non-canonical purine NTP pyrophosphatase [Acaryochloris sp. RU_4_1]|nr:RdgB/HAM1 family non-canonical purine NTP pyrophosphatase [Acaryochloris sp. SU_5_25]NJM64708.1 RdgB/HAM1 family non-canonical purine NTP pyrophosphatase [Acaryochloris sp. RU_4_1]NJR53929.1 RdgB/HAM1 family non-canonical purine NTP pyrophosphatase [Acaryochloris sp. CRU_2_0]